MAGLVPALLLALFGAWVGTFAWGAAAPAGAGAAAALPVPLGHHRLLAAWLGILLALAVLAAREPGPWRLSGLAAGGLALLAILASRSLAGFAALALEAVVGFVVRGGERQRRWWAILLAL